MADETPSEKLLLASMSTLRLSTERLKQTNDNLERHLAEEPVRRAMRNVRKESVKKAEKP
jgi:hypothetical protein